MFRRACVALLMCTLPVSVLAEDLDIVVTWLRHAEPERPVLSNLDPIPENRGLSGAELGLQDNQTTGRFLGQNYTLNIVDVATDDDPSAAAKTALAASPYLIFDGNAGSLLKIADLPEAANAIVFNSSAPDVSLRGDACRGNVLHTLPSDAMKADALMQFARLKRWDDLALIQGAAPEDTSWAEALKASATKFGMSLDDGKLWEFDADMRRNAAQEVPLFTQNLPDHDLLLVADVANDFARYIAYNTWEPRPIAGSEGLIPTAWAPVVEQWGAAQLHSRFQDLANRVMTPRDYAAWAAMRSIGEAVTRTKSGDPSTIMDYLLSEDFELAGFKGRPQSFRSWNGQMRQPIPMVTRSAVVAQAPLPGYLHQRTELDTLGIDDAEATCTAFN